MKLISWNVNGLRACLTHDFAASFAALDADVFSVQETKMQPGQADFAPRLHGIYILGGEEGLLRHSLLVQDRAAERGHRHRHRGARPRGPCADAGIPGVLPRQLLHPQQPGRLKRLDYRMTWEDAFRAYLLELDAKKPVILCGDLNVAHQEIDIKNARTNRMSAGFTDQERAKMTELLAAGFTDSFRAIHPDEVKYSWWSYRFHAREKNAGWRIDYFIVSNRIADKIKAAEIHNEVFGSDHCPVELDIDL